jgi:hypothetical protein
MILPDPTVQAAEGYPPGITVGGQEPIEGIPSPQKGKGLIDEGHQGNLVDDEAGIGGQRLGEARLPDLQLVPVGLVCES